MIGEDPCGALISKVSCIDGHFSRIPCLTERDIESCKAALSMFNSQPYSLNGRIPGWIREICKVMLSGDETAVLRACTLFHSLCLVRGMKHCVAFMSCGLDTMQNLLEKWGSVMEQLDWRIRYTVYAWMSLLAKQPFDFKLFISRQSYGLFQALVAKARNSVVGANLPEKGPAISFLVSTMRSDIGETEFVDMLSQSFRTRNYELAYHLLKQTPVHCKSFDLEELFDANELLGDREGAKWRCRLLALLYKRYGLEISNQQIAFYLFHPDIAIREEMARAMCRVITSADNAAELVGGLMAAMHRCSGKKEADMKVLHGVLLLLGHCLLELDGQGNPKITGCLQELLLEHSPDIIKALNFDYCKGTFSVGSVVRDAACFVVWSWSRRGWTVDASILDELLASALCDREIAIRRAACAAFQEAIGRSSLQAAPIQNGLELINMVNYYSISSWKQCAELFCQLYAMHEPLRPALDRRLTESVLPHWDASVRKAAGQIQGRLGCIDSDYLQQVIESPPLDLFLFHGACICYHHSPSVKAPFRLPQWLSEYTAKDLGFDMILEGVLLAACRSDSFAPDIVDLVRTALSVRSPRGNSGLLDAAFTCIQVHTRSETDQARHFLLSALPRADKERDCSIRCGWIGVLGLVPEWLAADRLYSYWRLLYRIYIQSSSGDILAVRARVACLEAMEQLIARYGVGSLEQADVESVLSVGFSDYAIDGMEGDVGSHVRSACIHLVQTILLKCSNSLPRGVLHGYLVGQSVGRLDKVRSLAVHALSVCFQSAPDADPFETVGRSPDLVAQCLPELVYTAGAPIESSAALSACRVLSNHPHLLCDDSLSGVGRGLRLQAAAETARRRIAEITQQTN